jgi:hypothetical protein
VSLKEPVHCAADGLGFGRGYDGRRQRITSLWVAIAPRNE